MRNRERRHAERSAQDARRPRFAIGVVAFAASLALGADGVWMGSYWLTTSEYTLGAGDTMKDALVAVVALAALFLAMLFLHFLEFRLLLRSQFGHHLFVIALS